MDLYSDEYFMKLALKQAMAAAENGEVPVGAVITSQNRVIAKAYNQTELLRDVTAHAEIIAITSAMNTLASKYLSDCTLYVTLEPCVMCAGAMKWAQLSRVVYGLGDEKNGFMKYGKEILHPKTKLEYGLLYEESQKLLTQFFEQKR